MQTIPTPNVEPRDTLSSFLSRSSGGMFFVVFHAQYRSLVIKVPHERKIGEAVDKIAASIAAITRPAIHGFMFISSVGNANLAFASSGYPTLAYIPSNAVRIPNGATISAIMKEDFTAVLSSLDFRIGWSPA